jgi:hypothetical protein
MMDEIVAAVSPKTMKRTPLTISDPVGKVVSKHTEYIDIPRARQCLDLLERLPKRTVREDGNLTYSRKLLSSENESREIAYTKKHIGRRYAAVAHLSVKRSMSVQGMPREIRSTLCGLRYHDYDLVNAIPTLMLAKFQQQYGITNTIQLQHYIVNREEWLERVVTESGEDRERAKQMVLTVLYGGNAQVPSLEKLKLELRKAREIVINAEGGLTHLYSVDNDEIANQQPASSFRATHTEMGGYGAFGDDRIRSAAGWRGRCFHIRRASDTQYHRPGCDERSHLRKRRSAHEGPREANVRHECAGCVH